MKKENNKNKSNSLRIAKGKPISIHTNIINNQRLIEAKLFEEQNKLMNSTASDLQNNCSKCGFLSKRGGGKVSKAWKKRWFILAGQNLFYFKSERDKKAKGCIYPLKEYEIISSEDFPNEKIFQFKISPRNKQGRIYHIHAQSLEEKEEWMEYLHSASNGLPLPTKNKKKAEIEEKLKKNNYEIYSEDLDWKQNSIIGKGASGIVTKGIWLKTTEVAIKSLSNVPEFTDEQETISFYKEIETLSQLRHPNIVPMFGYCKKDGYICLITEFIKGGNLADNLQNPKNKEILDNNYIKINLCCSICRGMVYLHSKNIIHRDLKPGNILVENLEEGKVKVCDFGLSKFTKGKNDDNNEEITFGSPPYAAPELPTENHTEKVDIYSFGIIMWEIFSGCRPWQELVHSWQIQEKVLNNERPTMPQDCIVDYLIRQCWDGNPDKRPSFSTLFKELESIKEKLPKYTKSCYNSEIIHNNTINNFDNTATSIITGRSLTNLPTLKIVENIFQGKTSISWSLFSKNLCQFAQISEEIVEKMKFCLLPENDVVRMENWITFLDWFPLQEHEMAFYGSHPQAENNLKKKFEDIVDIVGPEWFFGNLSANNAKEILSKLPSGSFLFRFSSQPGLYTLSVNYGGQIGHWRITTEKNSSGLTFYKIDNNSYVSLHKIIENHQLGNGQPLPVKGNNVPQNVFLDKPADRNFYLKSSNIYN